MALRRRLTGAGDDAGPGDDPLASRTPPRRVAVAATIGRYLHRAGLVTPQPHKRPRSSYVRFQAEQPNETWQADFTHDRLTTGLDVEVLWWLDDQPVTPCGSQPINASPEPIVLNEFRAAIADHGVPASTLTDNGMVFTTRLSGGNGRPQRLRSRPPPPRCPPEELPAQPPDNLRKSRALPADPQTLAHRPTRPADDHPRGASTARPLRRPLQPRTTPPIPTGAMHAAHAYQRRPKRLQATAATTATTASATTSSTTAERSPSGSTADSTTSASAPPTAAPESSSSPTTSRSESPTPPPASSPASSPSTRPRTTNLSAPTRAQTTPTTRTRVQVSPMSRDITESPRGDSNP